MKLLRLKTPGKFTWTAACALAALGFAFKFELMIIPGYYPEPFWFLTAGYALLALSNLIKLG